MPSQSIALIAADTHLDHLIWRNRPEIQGDSFFAFKQLVSMAIRRKLPLIIAGDVVETLPVNTPDSCTVAFLRAQMERLRRAGVPFYYVNGQHDKTAPAWPEACGGPPTHDSTTATIGGRNFYFLSWRPERLATEAVAATPPGTDVLIIHQVCRELMGGNFELKLSEVPHARMVISGDLHEFKHRRNVREQGKALQALSPGATCVRKSNEPAHHYLVELREDLSWKRLRLRSRIRIDYAIESARDFEQMFENLPETLDATAALAEEKKLPLELQRPFLMIKDSSDVLDLRRRLQQVVGDRVHLFYSKTSLGFEAEAALRDCNVAPELSVGEMINQETDNRDVAEFLTAALESDSPRQFLKQYRKKL